MTKTFQQFMTEGPSHIYKPKLPSSDPFDSGPGPSHIDPKRKDVIKIKPPKPGHVYKPKPPSLHPHPGISNKVK